MLFSTYRRDPAQQHCPWLKKMALAEPAMAVFNIAVAENHVGRLAAQFQRHLLEVPGSRLKNQFANFGGAGEGDLVDIGMRRQGSARGLAVSRDDVHDAVRNPGFLNQFAQAQAGQRRLLRRLDDHGASRRQCRAQLPGRHQQREIPGNNLADHSDWLAQCVSQKLAPGGNRNRVAFDLGRPSRHVAEQVHRQADIRDSRHFEWLAVVQHFQLGKFFQVLLQQVAELPDHASPLRGRHFGPRPGFESGAGRLYGALDIFTISFRNAGQDLARGRIVRRECFAGSGLHPLAVNEHLAVLGNVACDFVAQQERSTLRLP